MGDYNENKILAVIAHKEHKEMISGGGIPVFFIENKKELENIAMLLARLTLGMVHELKPGLKIIIRH